ncbi:DNA polymerase I [Oscillospiraceae bacterium LTW-04]|nr:DNA polymerase I [Oscillospiraceae bacterium MB24-C1]
MKLLAVDSNSILNRAYYGVRPLTTREGLFTNGIYGFLNILFKICEEVNPDIVVFAFDLKAPTFRHKLYDGYKAQRKGMPEELAQQLDPLKELLGYLGYPILSVEGYEADDILGTLAATCRNNGCECIIATGDRDSFQLIGGGVTVRLAFTRGGQSGAELVDEVTVQEKYGVSPKQMIDVKALMGDPSDNIPGVAGIGEKTALSLISSFDTLDGVYEHLDDPAIKKGVRQKLIDGRDSAYQSRVLAEINCAVPLDKTLNDLVPAPQEADKLFSLLDRLELRSIITRLNLSPPAFPETSTSVSQPEAAVIPVLINDVDKTRALFSEDSLTVCLHFSGNKPTAAAILGSSLALLDADCAELESLLADLSQSAAELTLPNSKDWYRYLYLSNIEGSDIKFDPILAGYLLSPLASSYTISTLCSGRTLARQVFDLPDTLSEAFATLADDMQVLPALCVQLRDEIREKEMEMLLVDIEQPLARVLASMETLGFALDADGLKSFGDDLDTDIAELTQRIYFLAGGEFNINSPKQLGEVLFDRLGLPAKRKTKSGYSTDADTLDSLRNKHPIIEDVLSYRKLAKLKSTYVEGLLAQLDADGRVRSIFRQTETRTGRISSTEPNLQNIPVRTERGSRLRRFFVADKGCLLVDADYSQIELRVLAHIANDTAMIDAFMHDEDIHTKTAAQVFDMPEAFVTPQMRSSAKAVNFGIVYGIGAFSLSQDIGVSVAEADRYIKSYLATYQGVHDYMQETIAFGKAHGYVKTLFGRRRPMPELAATNRITKAFGERVAMNTPIQGTAADIIKLAMVKVFSRLKKEKMRTRLILQVHDELIVEAPADEADRAAAILTEEMQNAVSLKVAMVAKASIGENWLEAK